MQECSERKICFYEVMYNYTEMFYFKLTYFIFIGKGLPGDSGPSGAKGGQVRRDSDKKFNQKP